jgi:hypothetical protein
MFVVVVVLVVVVVEVVVMVMMICFTSGKKHQYPLNRRLGGTPVPSRHFTKQTNLLLLLGFESQIVQPIA